MAQVLLSKIINWRISLNLVSFVSWKRFIRYCYKIKSAQLETKTCLIHKFKSSQVQMYSILWGSEKIALFSILILTAGLIIELTGDRLTGEKNKYNYICIYADSIRIWSLKDKLDNCNLYAILSWGERGGYWFETSKGRKAVHL